MEAPAPIHNWLQQGKGLIEELEIDIRVAENDLAEKKALLKHMLRVFPSANGKREGGGTRGTYAKCPDCGEHRNSKQHRETCGLENEAEHGSQD